MATRTSYMVIGMDQPFVQDEVIQVEPYNPVQPQIITEVVTVVSGGYGGLVKVESEPLS